MPRVTRSQKRKEPEVVEEEEEEEVTIVVPHVAVPSRLPVRDGQTGKKSSSSVKAKAAAIEGGAGMKCISGSKATTTTTTTTTKEEDIVAVAIAPASSTSNSISTPKRRSNNNKLSNSTTHTTITTTRILRSSKKTVSEISISAASTTTTSTTTLNNIIRERILPIPQIQIEEVFTEDIFISSEEEGKEEEEEVQPVLKNPEPLLKIAAVVEEEEQQAATTEENPELQQQSDSEIDMGKKGRRNKKLAKNKRGPKAPAKGSNSTSVSTSRTTSRSSSRQTQRLADDPVNARQVTSSTVNADNNSKDKKKASGPQTTSQTAAATRTTRALRTTEPKPSANDSGKQSATSSSASSSNPGCSLVKERSKDEIAPPSPSKGAATRRMTRQRKEELPSTPASASTSGPVTQPEPPKDISAKAKPSVVTLQSAPGAANTRQMKETDRKTTDNKENNIPTKAQPTPPSPSKAKVEKMDLVHDMKKQTDSVKAPLAVENQIDNALSDTNSSSPFVNNTVGKSNATRGSPLKKMVLQRMLEDIPRVPQLSPGSRSRSTSPVKIQGSREFNDLKSIYTLEPFEGPKKPMPIPNEQNITKDKDDSASSAKDSITSEPSAGPKQVQKPKPTGPATPKASDKRGTVTTAAKKPSAPIAMTKSALLKAESAASSRGKPNPGVKTTSASPQKPSVIRKLPGKESLATSRKPATDIKVASTTTKGTTSKGGDIVAVNPAPKPRALPEVKTGATMTPKLQKTTSTLFGASKPSKPAIHVTSAAASPVKTLMKSASAAQLRSSPTVKTLMKSASSVQLSPSKKAPLPARAPGIASTSTSAARSRSPAKHEITRPHSASMKSTAAAAAVNGAPGQPSAAQSSPAKPVISDFRKRMASAPKPIIKSTKPLTKPSFELPGEARAREMAERRAERAKKKEQADAEAKNQSKTVRHAAQKAAVGPRPSSAAQVARGKTAINPRPDFSKLRDLPIAGPKPSEEASASVSTTKGDKDGVTSITAGGGGENLFPVLSLPGDDLYPNLPSADKKVVKKSSEPQLPLPVVDESLAERRKEERALASLRGLKLVNDWAASRGLPASPAKV